MARPKKLDDDKTTSIRLPRQLRQAVMDEAERRQTTMTEIVIESLETAFSRPSKSNRIDPFI